MGGRMQHSGCATAVSCFSIPCPCLAWPLHPPQHPSPSPPGPRPCARVQDEDPHVRKTAAVCVAKLFDINAELVEDRGFLDMLKVGLRCYIWGRGWQERGQGACGGWGALM